MFRCSICEHDFEKESSPTYHKEKSVQDLSVNFVQYNSKMKAV